METCTNCIYKSDIKDTIEYNKNTVVFYEDDKIDNIYFIKDGVIKLTKLYPNGEEKIMDILTKGDFIALLTIMQNKNNYLVTATAITQVTLEIIDKEKAIKNYNQNILFKEKCIECASNRIGNLHDMVYGVNNLDKEDQVLETLKNLYSKFGFEQNKKHYIYLPISKTDLASLIGIRRETLSRKLTKLQKENKIKVKKNIYEIMNM